LRVLITETTQGYPAALALRPHASRIVGLYYSSYRRGGTLSSRAYDAVYYVPPTEPELDWAQLMASKSTQSAEEEQFDLILAICQGEAIDVILPTDDVHVCLLSKHIDRLHALGVRLAAPSFETVRILTDKYIVQREAAAAGVACPLTLLPSTDNDLCDVIERVGLPLIVKARFSSYGAGIRLCKTVDEAMLAFRELSSPFARAVLQEYIPGGSEPSINFVFDARSEPSIVFTLRKLRYAAASMSTCIQVVPHLPETQKVAYFGRSIGCTGFATFQMKYDPRDGRHKLIEANSRLGANSRIHLRMGLRSGINAVLTAVNGAAFGECSSPRRSYSIGTVGVAPIDDVASLIKYIAARSERLRRGAPQPIISFRTLLNSYYQSYTWRGLVIDAWSSNLAIDPFAVVTRCYLVLRQVWRAPTTFLPYSDALPVGGYRRRSVFKSFTRRPCAPENRQENN